MFAVPLGRLADRLGTRFSWIVGAILQALLFGAWVLVGNFAAYLAVEVLLALASSWQKSGRDAYRISVFPAATRVRGFAYMRAARNVGYTLGTVWAPAAYTFLAMELGHLGWAIIAGIIVTAAIGVHPSARAAERHLARRAQPIPAPA